MKKQELIKGLNSLKTERELNEYNEKHKFRLGYVKAMNDATNLVEKLSLGNVIDTACPSCQTKMEFSSVNLACPKCNTMLRNC